MLLSRTLPRESVGEIAFANAVAVPLAVVLDAGLVQLLIREFRTSSDGVLGGLPPTLRRTLRIRYAAFLGFILVVGGSSWAFGESEQRLLIGLAIGVSYAADATTQVWLTPARAALNMRPDFALRAGQGIGVLAATGGAFAVFGANAGVAAVAYGGVFVLSAIATAPLWLRSHRWLTDSEIRLDRHQGQVHDRRQFGVIAVMTTAYSRADAIVIQLVLGSGALAVYTVAFKLVEAARIAPGAISRALMARVTSAGRAEHVSWPAEITVSALVGLLSSLALFGIGPGVLAGLFGTDYARAGTDTLRLLGITTLGIGFTAPLTALLLSYGYSTQVRTWTLLTLLVTLASIVPLTRTHGIEGAALAVLLGELTSIFLFSRWAVARYGFSMGPASLLTVGVALVSGSACLLVDPLSALGIAVAALGLVATAAAAAPGLRVSLKGGAA